MTTVHFPILEGDAEGILMRFLEVELKKRGRPIDRYSKEEQGVLKRFREATTNETEARELFLAWKQHKTQGAYGIEDLLGYGQRSWIATSLQGPNLAPVMCKSSPAPVRTAETEARPVPETSETCVIQPKEKPSFLKTPMEGVVEPKAERALCDVVASARSAGYEVVEYGDDVAVKVPEGCTQASFQELLRKESVQNEAEQLEPMEQMAEMVIACEMLPQPHDPNFSLTCVDGNWLLRSKGRLHIAAVGPVESLERMASLLAEDEFPSRLMWGDDHWWMRQVDSAVSQWEEVVAWSSDRWKYCRPSQIKLIKGSYFALSETTELVLPRVKLGVDKVEYCVAKLLGMSKDRISFVSEGQRVHGMWDQVPSRLALAVDGCWSPPAVRLSTPGKVVVYHPLFATTYCPLPYVWTGQQSQAVPRPKIEVPLIRNLLIQSGVKPKVADYMEVRMSQEFCDHNNCSCVLRVDLPRLNVTVKATGGLLGDQIKELALKLLEVKLPKVPTLRELIKTPSFQCPITWTPSAQSWVQEVCRVQHEFRGHMVCSGSAEGLWALDGMKINNGREFVVNLPEYSDWYHMKHRAFVVFSYLRPEVEKRIRMMGGRGKIFYLFPTMAHRNRALQMLNSEDVVEVEDWEC